MIFLKLSLFHSRIIAFLKFQDVDLSVSPADIMVFHLLKWWLLKEIVALTVGGIGDLGNSQGQLALLSVICAVLIKYQTKAGLNG